MDRQQSETLHIWTADLETKRPVIFISRFTDESGHVSTVCKHIDNKYLCHKHPIAAALNYPDGDHIAFLQACQLSVFRIGKTDLQSDQQAVPIDYMISIPLYGRYFHDPESPLSKTNHHGKTHVVKLSKSAFVEDASVYRDSLYVLFYTTTTIDEYVDTGDEFDELISGRVLKGSEQLVLERIDRIDIDDGYKYVARSMTIPPRMVYKDRVKHMSDLFNGLDEDREVLIYVHRKDIETQKDIWSRLYIIDHDRFSIKRVLRRKVRNVT
jgi:hypothetical protein